MFTRTLSLTVCFLGLMLLAGCGSAPKLEKVGVRIKEISLAPSGATITLLFINPNNVPLVVPSTEHTLRLGGVPAGVIKNEKPLGIPPLGSVVETIPLPASVARIAGAHPGTTTYILESKLNLNWDDDIHAYKTSDRGSVTLAPATVAP